MYGLLLRLYPRDFVEEYGEDLRQSVRDRLDEDRFRGATGRLRLWMFLLADLARSAPTAWWRAAREQREREGRTTMGDLRRDLALATRTFRRRPGFFLTAALTLALGVGAATAIFSVVDGVILRPLPYPEPDRLVQLGTTYGESTRLSSTSPPDFEDWRERNRVMASLAASRLERRTLLGDGPPTSLETAGVSPSFFGLLGAEPALGRGLAEEDGRPGAAPVTVVSHGLWRSRWGGDSGVVGRTLRLDGVPFTVVGVMGPDFHPPEAIHHQDVQAWYPLVHVDDPLDQRGFGFLQVIGRLADGATLEGARQEMAAIGRALSAEYPENGERGVAMEPLIVRTVGDVGGTLGMLLGAVGLLLLIACVNVAHLFLVRATEREREMALRNVLGAGRGRVVRQLLAESLVLALVSGVLAVLVAYGGVEAFRAFGPGDLPRLSEVAVDGRVLLFALALSALTGIAFGLVPARSAARLDPAVALRESGTATSAGRRRAKLRSGLVIAETAVAMVLCVGAGLLVNSFVRLHRVDPGFDPEGVAWLQVRAPDAADTDEARVRFFQDVLARVRAVPGVVSAGGGNNLPLDGNQSLTGITPDGMALGADERPPAVSFHQVMPGYFEALDVPVMEGRVPGEQDVAGAPNVAVVNRALAHRLWPGGAVGGRFTFGVPDEDSEWWTVVGVVGDVRQQALATEAEGELYVPFLQRPRTILRVTASTAGDPGAALPAIRRAVWSIDPDLPLDQAGTLRSTVAQSVVEPRFYTLLLSGFAAVALALALVGIYGTLAYTVEQRARELGVRMALGADAGSVRRMVLRRGMVLAAVGVAVGGGSALVATRALEGFVYGIEPSDPATLAGVTVAILGVTALACWIPALRATRLDPAVTLRAE